MPSFVAWEGGFYKQVGIVILKNNNSGLIRTINAFIFR
jgi:hypothetical protein